MFTWRDLNAKRVSRQSLDAVVSFFSAYQRETGRNYITIRLFDLAENVGLAVGTLHKALTDLEESNVIEIIPNKGNNTPKSYIFKKDLTNYEPILSREEKKIADHTVEIRRLKSQLKMYEDFVNRIQDVQYKDGHAIITVRSAADGSVGLPLRFGSLPKMGQKIFNPQEYMN